MKKHLSLLLVILLLASTLFTVGCNPNDTSDDVPGTESESESQTEATTEATTEAEVDDPTEKGYEGRSEFIDQLGGVSDTYKGSVSEVSYTSATDAAEAYVQQEVVGNAQATQISAVSKGEMSEQDIAALEIPAEFSQGIVAVEVMEVSYAVAQSSESASTPRLQKISNESRKTTVYVIKYANDYKYFSPAPVKGDTITKSYYDSVFNAEKYQNCTMTSEMKMVIDMKEIYQGQPDSAYMLTKTKRTVKYDSGRILLEETAEMSMYGETMTQTASVYLEEVDGEILCYVKMDGSDSWEEADLATLGFAGLQELTPFYDQYLDYSYFTKTRYGFALNEENAERFVRQTLSSDPSASAVLNYQGMKIDMFAEYYVSDGVLSGMREDCDINVNNTYEDLTIMMDMTIDIVTTCTDYGTTHVEKPVGN